MGFFGFASLLRHILPKSANTAIITKKFLGHNHKSITPKFHLDFLIFCFRPSFHVSCPACGVKFCSKACLDEAVDSFHKTLCVEGSSDHPLVTLNEIWKTCHYPPESTRFVLTFLVGPTTSEKSFNVQIAKFFQKVLFKKASVSSRLRG